MYVEFIYLFLIIYLNSDTCWKCYFTLTILKVKYMITAITSWLILSLISFQMCQIVEGSKDKVS